MSDNEQLSSLLSDDAKEEENVEEVLASLPKQAGSANLQVDFLRARIDRLKEENNGLTQDRQQRKTFSYYIYGFMCVYSLITLSLVFLVGISAACLSDTVLVTLLTTSLADVIGLFIVVAKYLFPQHKD